MIHFIITILVLLLLLVVNKSKKGRTLNIANFVLLLYLFSVITSLLYINNAKIQEIAYNNALIPFALLFCIFIVIYFWPLLNHNESKFIGLKLPNQGLLDVFSIFIIVISFVAIVYFLPIAITVMSMADLSDARGMATADGNQFIRVGLLNTIASTAASFYNIALILSFVYLSKGHRKILAGLLFVSSFSYVLNVFAYAGRDGVVFWVFSFFVTYLYFKDYLSGKIKKQIKKIFAILCAVGVGLFLAISRDRFEDSMMESFVSYYGQPYINFCFYCQDGFYYTPGLDFPLFRELLGLPETPRDLWQVGNSSSWTWGTLFRTFIENLGVVGAIILGLVVSVLVNKIIRRGNKFDRLSSLFVLFMYLQVLMQGVFYFRQCNRGGNLFIIISFFLYGIFNPLCIKSNNYIVKNATGISNKFNG